MNRVRRWTLGIVVLLLVSLIGPGTLPVSASAPLGMDPVLLQADIDSDLDGLSDVREAEIGTDPDLADTDGDGLLDGEEVDEFGTDPFTFDSDGDTFPDPLEIEAGTDPLDADSTPLDPDAIRTLGVTIFACPPGSSVPVQPSTCDPVADADVTISLSPAGSGSPQTRKSDADGSVSFTDLGPGTYVITEELPSADLVVEDLQVRCGAGGEGFVVEPSGNSITLELGLGGRYGCSFFNVLADQGSAGSQLTVEALLCPTGYDDADYFTVCDAPAEDVLVTVRPEATGVEVTAETDARGLVSFGGLAAGPTDVELGVPGDFARFQVFCGIPGAPEYLTLEDARTNRITLTFGTAAIIACTWFIVPEDAGAPTATAGAGTAPTVASTTVAATRTAGDVSDLPNTGAGTPTTAAESTLLLMIIALIGGVSITLIALRRAGRP